MPKKKQEIWLADWFFITKSKGNKKGVEIRVKDVVCYKMPFKELIKHNNYYTYKCIVRNMHKSTYNMLAENKNGMKKVVRIEFKKYINNSNF